ncbi:MAG: tRNA uridine-5-carboxymethylaminomethyl(34) synthesis GTPase MnmE [Granulosicoccus sp.]
MTSEGVVTDTITAVSTGSGKAGIGVIRVSGPLVQQISRAITDADLIPRHAHYLPFLDENAQVLDEGVVILFEAPHSFTGEDVLELQGHGGAVILDMLLARVLQLGARAARPGEFSERAFHNNKLDLAQAEAISDLIESSSTAAARAAVRSMRGEFSTHIHRINDELVGLRVWLEAALDFSEEDIDFLADPQLRQRTAVLVEDFDSLLAKAEQGQRLRDGLSIVIAGATNAGKSSLLNCLSGDDTAIVTDIAGTTRDVLRTDITIEGVPLHIIDTAGVRETDDVVEQLGIERAYKAVDQADHVLVLLDATAPEMPVLPDIDKQRLSIVLSKTDLVDNSTLKALEAQWESRLGVSMKTGQGISALRTFLLKIAGHDQQVEGVYIARRRHIQAIEAARQSTQAALSRLKENTMPELAAEELRLAQQSLATITGRFDSEDLLGEIFSSFCIGK